MDVTIYHLYCKWFLYNVLKEKFLNYTLQKPIETRLHDLEKKIDKLSAKHDKILANQTKILELLSTQQKSKPTKIPVDGKIRVSVKWQECTAILSYSFMITVSLQCLIKCHCVIPITFDDILRLLYYYQVAYIQMDILNGYQTRKNTTEYEFFTRLLGHFLFFIIKSIKI